MFAKYPLNTNFSTSMEFFVAKSLPGEEFLLSREVMQYLTDSFVINHAFDTV